MSSPASSPCDEELRDSIAAYALDALDEAETREVEAHLRGCDSCDSWLQWIRPAVDVVPTTVERVDPPPSLRRDLLREVRADARTHARAERGSQPGRWRGFDLRPVAALAATAVVVAGALFGYAVRGVDEPSGPESKLIAVRASDALPASASVTLEREGDRGTLHVESLPSTPEDTVYQAWIQRDVKMEPSTPFVVRNDGTNEVAVDGSLAGADAVLVTEEPQGGSDTPSDRPILRADLD